VNARTTLRQAKRFAVAAVPARHADALARIALRARSLHRGADYSKFVIVGAARTGSTLLVDLLNAHSQVLAFGELFRTPEAIGWDVRPFVTYQSPRLIDLYRADPVAFLERSVFRRWPANYAAVGFKLFYYHARQPPQSVVWDHLASDRSIRILHIKRRNLLAQYLSLLIAHKTDVWSTTRSPADPPVPLRIDVEACRKYFLDVRRSEDECAGFFKNHAIRNVYYESLARNYACEMQGIADFLGVRQERIGSALVRQNKDPVSQTITNYDELKRAFANTRWQEFFCDRDD
jgi:LPS sulfotransferase NodH